VNGSRPQQQDINLDDSLNLKLEGECHEQNGLVALAATLMGAILLLERTAAAASPTGIKNVVLVHGAFADGSGWEDGRSCVFLVLGVGTAVLHDISSMLTCRTLLIRSRSFLSATYRWPSDCVSTTA
jgi:hypothetical protein